MTDHLASITAVVPVLRETSGLEETHAYYRDALEAAADSVRIVYVVDGPLPQVRTTLRTLKRRGEPIDVLMFPQPFGEAAALSVGLQAAEGEVVVTMPAEPQLDTHDLPLLLAGLERADVVIGRRSHMMDESRGRGSKLDALVNRIFKTSMRDVRSPVRALSGEAARELIFYGNQYRFVPLMAQGQGFVVTEVDVRTKRAGQRAGRLLPFDLSLILDLCTMFFLLRFMRKPFRFFGGFGFSVLALGLVLTAWLIIGRLFLGVPLVDRPALVLTTLLVVLGIQVISVGLIGEIVTFTYAKDIKDYRVERLVDAETTRAVEAMRV